MRALAFSKVQKIQKTPQNHPGRKMEDSDLVLLILAGLEDEYESLIQNVTSRRDDVKIVGN